MAHAEIDCLTNAGRQKTYRDTVLYTTISPCLLCAGAILQFGIPRIVIGDTTNFAGGECGAIKSMQLLRECGVEIVEAQNAECTEMIAKFATENPTIWREDNGQATT